ncbi:hypothetical protein CEUSTIGMA_g5238.t1 [Chlamydomonas eustigma]|uniref:Methionine aminopeptidase n=1 Tax=Chlamydomonas eustigma TaxID=1157962 RepID=A0A250X3Z6_9CHLO|nr:hypothetical protein CEUSTIGMA_g5238.t1 [Chlamydomonas eustigma]|eukprot:GAX77795.1 hypothetical protein CEUSTIGMA_g5238.t1 [Chlamydomonas eustigma]
MSESNAYDIIKTLPCVRCSAPAKLQCPKCIELGLPRPSSVFCTQGCFKEAWPQHKACHKPAADSWLYCLKRGKTRSETMPNFDWTGPLRPCRIGPTRQIPDSILKPDYYKDGIPMSEQSSRQQMQVPSRSGKELEGIRAACVAGREVLDLAAAAVRPGVTTDELDRIVHDGMMERGAFPSPYNYYNFPKSVCTSVNEVICHGIPDARELQDGDIVNVDVTAYLVGYHGDLNETFTVGNVDEEGKAVIKVAHDCLMKALAICKPGTRFQVVRTYCGHGIGDLFHCAPNIPHYSGNKAVGVMKEGHVFTIEPMINVGSWRDRTWPDGWTSVTEDGKRSAQFEHTVVVTKDGVDILTRRTDSSPPLWWEQQ